ncbi:hypothetical protein [Hydrogenophaga sp. BPS33]|nr:hypothetical protein [Hydrogenophaga sp. BPS33]
MAHHTTIAFRKDVHMAFVAFITALAAWFTVLSPSNSDAVRVV